MRSYVLVLVTVIVTILSARAAVLPAADIKVMVDAGFKVFDQNGDGKVTLDEELTYFKKYPDVTEAEVKADFTKDDLNADGSIDKAEATAAVEKKTEEEFVEEIVAGVLVELKGVDANEDGKVTKEEATAYVQKHKQQ